MLLAKSIRLFNKPLKSEVNAIEIFFENQSIINFLFYLCYLLKCYTINNIILIKSFKSYQNIITLILWKICIYIDKPSQTKLSQNIWFNNHTWKIGEAFRTTLYFINWTDEVQGCTKSFSYFSSMVIKPNVLKKFCLRWFVNTYKKQEEISKMNYS